MELFNGLMSFVKNNSTDDNLTPTQVAKIARGILEDNEFKDTLLICMRYYKGKVLEEEIKNDRMGNSKRK